MKALEFKCPGCKLTHSLTLFPAVSNNGATWHWNGLLHKATITPSVNFRVDYTQAERKSIICHSIILDGAITFCGDSTHSCAGLTLPLPEVFVKQ